MDTHSTNLAKSDGTRLVCTHKQGSFTPPESHTLPTTDMNKHSAFRPSLRLPESWQTSFCLVRSSSSYNCSTSYWLCVFDQTEIISLNSTHSRSTTVTKHSTSSSQFDECGCCVNLSTTIQLVTKFECP